MRDPLCGTRPHPFSATDFVDPCFHPKYMEKASRFAHEVHDEPLFLSHKPTMPLFTFMPTSPGDGGLRIIEMIGAKYRALGILLLDDKNGVKTEAAVASHPHQPATITHSILSSWLNGRGKEPVTWATFIAVLYQVGLRDLARDIEKQTTQNTLPSEPTSDFTQDPKQNTAGAPDAEEQTKQERELVAVNGSESLSIVILATSSDEVKKMIEVLYNRFSDLKNFVKESLEKHGVFVKKVVDVLTSLSLDDDEHHKMFLETHVKALVTAADNSELFVTMNFHWNYLDPSLLDHLVRKLDLNKVKAQMEAYKLDLQKFRTKTPLSMYCQAHKRKRIKLPPDFQEVLAEFSWSEHIHITLEVVEQFRQEYASHYKLHEFAMMLSEVRPGSFVVTWVIPQSITEKLEQNLPREILRKYYVTKLMVAETLVYSCPVTEAPETHPITMTNDDYLLRPSNALDERISHSSPSSPLLRRKSVKNNRRCSSFRSSNSTKKERKVSKLPTPPNSPRSLLQSVKSRLCSQKPSPPSLVLPSPPTISPPSIKVSPIDPDVLPPSPPFIQVSSDIPLTPPSTPCTRASCTDNKRENEGTTHIIAIPGGGEGQNLVPNQLRADPSISSMESDYSTDASRQSKLSLDSRGSVSNILEDSEDKNQHRASCGPTVNQGDTRTIPESFSNSVGSTTAPVEKPQVVDASDKHMHPKSRFRIGPSSNVVVQTLCSISEGSPSNQASDSPSPDSSTSPARSTTSSSSSTTSSSSSTTSSSSSLISSSVSPPSSRRSSISYSSFRKSRRSTLSRSPSLKSRDLAHRRTSFKRQRASLTSVTKFYRVTPKQYLKTSRATSALNISEVMSDDEGSVTSSLRRLYISIPGTQHAKSDKECSHKSHEGLTGKQQDLVEAKAKQKPPKGGGAKLSQSLPQHFGSSSPLPWAGSSHNNADKDMKTWFQKEVQELKRKMERKLAKYSRDCRKMRREVKEYKDRVCRCRSSSNSSAGAADHAQSSASCLHRERSVCSTRTSYTPTLHSPTLQTVKQPEELPCQRVDRAVIRDLSQDLLSWVWPARSLGLDDSDIQRIKLDNAGDTREQSYQMLSVWLQRYPCDATYQTLGHVLLTEASSVYPRYVDIVSKHCL